MNMVILAAVIGIGLFWRALYNYGDLNGDDGELSGLNLTAALVITIVTLLYAVRSSFGTD